MKVNVSSVLVFALSGTLMGQSEIGRSEQSAFPAQIKHVVVIFQENRTPDNLFQSLRPLCPIPAGAKGLSACTPSPVTDTCYNISPCGLSNESGSVKPVPLTKASLAGTSDPSHSHSAFEKMCDPDPGHGYVCRNDGAWRIEHGNSYEYVENAKVQNYDKSNGHLLDPYVTYAEQYGWANYMYQTNQGPSYPAHQYIFSGTSARSTAEDRASTFMSENFFPSTIPVGCLAPSDATTSVVSPLLPGDTLCAGGTAYDGNSVQECPITNTALVYPSNPVGSFCNEKPTMASLLDAADISWKYYSPSAGNIWTAPNSIQQICDPQFGADGSRNLECTGTEWANNVDLKLKGADILNDITGCNLAQVSWVIPDGAWSDHAGTTKPYGPSWVAAVINAIGQNPPCTSGIDEDETFWKNTAILLTWDDWGGWSDHEPPSMSPSRLPCTSSSCQADYQYGFRVPLVVVSAYTKQGYISNTTYDFGSILRTIEGIYDIEEGALGVADARASTDLSDFFQGPFRTYTPVPALEPASFFLGKDVQDAPPTPPDDDGDDD